MANNFTSATPNLNAGYTAQTNFGIYNRQIWTRIPNSTTAVSASTGGQCTAQRYPIRPVIPSVGAGCDGFIATGISLVSAASSNLTIVGLEYLLGTITLPGTFTDGVVMPTKKVRGASIQTAASMVFGVVSTTVVGTPTVNITYTDQDGNTGNTMTFTTPAGPQLNTALLLSNRFASGDTGIRDITAMTQSGGTSGVIQIYGILPLHIEYQLNANSPVSILSNPIVPYLLAPGEFLGFYRLFQNGTVEMYASINLTPEPT